MWDEMMIKPGLEFSSKYDILEGYEDLGSDVGGRSPKIATHVLVFMVGGLIHNWKQPFFYIPSAGPVSASNLIILINKVLELAFEVGFIIKHMVCDQSKGNQSAAEQLGITPENPSYTFNENKITFGFDVPHIIKCIRNNLISNNYKVDGNIVSWMPIKKLYELEKGKSCRAAPKLSKRHIEPNNFEKMKVSLAVQVFSHSVGAALMAATMNREVGLNNTDLEIAGATSDFCSRIDRIFDCLNARTSADSNPYRRGLSSKSTIVEDELKKSLTWLKLIYDPTKSPAFSNLILTINGILLLWDRLKAEGVSYLLTSRLNQDKLENFFGFVRERCGYNNNPTLTQCVKNIQYAVLVTVLMPAVGGNCESDDARLLISNFNKYTVDETGDLTDKIDEKVAEWFSNNEEYWVKLNSEDETADTSENTTGTLNDSHTTTASPTVGPTRSHSLAIRRVNHIFQVLRVFFIMEREYSEVIEELRRVLRLGERIDESVLNEGIRYLENALSSILPRSKKHKCQSQLSHLLSIRARYEKRGSGLSDDELRIKWEDVKSAFSCRIRTGQIVNFKHKDATAFLEDAFTIFEERIKETLTKHSMIKVNVELAAEYMTLNKDGEFIFGDKYFNTKNEHISQSTDLGEWFISNVKEPILKQMEEFEEEGSGWALSKILHLLVNINKYNPSRVGSYIPLPDTIAKKEACVNVKNFDDFCFKWAILAA
uniref:Transposable element P transposase n=1 Tax=Trichogramma kaykai TaxID=54128 RepID=A0ABD2XIE7_9HYME